MNSIAKEILSYLSEDSSDDSLMHYGVARRSGRYPWGSGDDPYQHDSRDFIGRVEELRKQGITYTDEKTGKKYTGDTAIAKSLGLTTGQFRTELALAKDERRMKNVAAAKSMKSDGLGESEIGRRLGVNESTVRSWLNPKSEARMDQARNTADHIKKQVDKYGMVDVGKGVEGELNISKEKLEQSLYLLEREGYHLYQGRIPQPTNPGNFTTQRVLCVPGTPHSDIYKYDKVHALNEDDYVSHDGGDTFDKFVYPKSMDSSRLMIRYADDVGPDGARGVDKDGIVELRRGVADLSLGESRYSQVRIMVDDKKYIKGMAVYSDDMPDGVDVVFNTNKSSSVSKLDVLKDIKSNKENPFGSLIKAGGQSYYIDENGQRQLSLINKRADQGDWTEWKDALPSQFLGKQKITMIKKQLNLAKADKYAEFDEICALENPTIKKHLLEKFASSCDSASVHLKAAALPGQKYHVIIPINSLKDNEVYAPRYENGTKLALVRYPHGGTFEIPILTVNNKNKLARGIIGDDSEDAVGINKNVADRLSGADFDGDTVMAIPTHDSSGKVKVSSTPPLKGLEGFDPKMAYPEREGMRYMKNPKTGKDATQSEMGAISNLITDMTLQGATQDELARAVRHSMVVIDAAKHKLDYKKSEQDNDIKSLKKKYQIGIDKDGNEKYGGASTILSRSKGDHSVVKRQGTPKINMKGEEWYDPSRPEGALIYKTADDAYYTVTKTNKRTGKTTTTVKARPQKSTNMAETDDAHTLVSTMRNPKELVYAEYANSMKALANEARKTMVTTGKIEYSKAARTEYKTEVDSLMTKLKNAILNKPKERAAARLANADVASQMEDNPDMTKSEVKKAKAQAMTKYRSEVGSVARSKRNIEITDREWEAIQKGAISENVLKQILDNTDTAALRQRATPRASTTLSTAKVNKIKAMNASNYSLAEIAKSLGVSPSTVSKYLKGAN